MRLASALIALLLAPPSLHAATTVLFDTAWEASPAYPAWAPGAVGGQNGWLNFNSATGHMVVGNGTAGALIGTQAVTTPYGAQFHRFWGSARTDGVFDRVAWPNILATYNSRPTDQKIVKGSIDIFVPRTQTDDATLYGIVAYHGTTPNVVDSASILAWGVLIQPFDRSVNTLADGELPTYRENAFTLDTWFNVTVTANYDTGLISVDFNGVNMPDLTSTSSGMLTSGLTVLGLFVENAATPPTVRSIFTDNFRLTTEGGAEVRPTLTIARGAAGKWHLSWSATYSNWILESSQNIASSVWTSESVTPIVSGSVASVDLPEATAHKFYRLRKP
jgi:hypothetical protein